MKEIDLLIEEGGFLYPIEMRKHADPQKRDMDVGQRISMWGSGLTEEWSFLPIVS